MTMWSLESSGVSLNYGAADSEQVIGISILSQMRLQMRDLPIARTCMCMCLINISYTDTYTNDTTGCAHHSSDC